MQGAASPVPGRHVPASAAAHDHAIDPRPGGDLDALLALLEDRRLLLLAAPYPGAGLGAAAGAGSTVRTPAVPSATPRQLLITAGRADPAAMCLVSGGLALRAVAAGEPAAAATLVIDCLEHAAGRAPWHGAALPLVALALAAADAGDHASVARLHAGVRVVQAEVAVLLASWIDRYAGAVRRAREALGEAAFEALLAGEPAAGPDSAAPPCPSGGTAWSGALAFARAYAETLRMRPRVASDWTWAPPASDVGLVTAGAREPARPPYGVAPAAARPPERLTPRELDVLRQLAQGHTNNEIGLRLGLRPKTVMHHSVSIYAKLGVRGRAEATAWAFRNGVMEADPPA